MAKRRAAARRDAAGRAPRRAPTGHSTRTTRRCSRRWLSGRHAQSLREYFGAPAYADLSALAAAAKKRREAARAPSADPAGNHGLEDSAADARRGQVAAACGEVLWIDPLQIAAGRLTA